MGPPPGAGVSCRGGCGFSRLLAWCFLLALSPQAPGSRGAEAVWTAYLNVSWRVPHTGVNRTVWELSEEGVYGQDSPLEPVAGVLVPPDGPGALNACNPHTNFTVPTVPGDWGSSVQVSWLALIQRGGGCTFADKIHLAYERGASGAVIFNFPGTRNEVIPMSHPGNNKIIKIRITEQNLRSSNILAIFQVDVEDGSVSLQVPASNEASNSASPHEEDNRSETASSGYASVQGADEPPLEEHVQSANENLQLVNHEASSMAVDVVPHVDNPTFEEDETPDRETAVREIKS
ncbi:hypothetical protein E2I00_008576 [Balaenoptera physalus]|uniref:PA domain-containing protein n=1 Tax=Balaenoptera physalus TaxID=9770 RepID=A0A643BSM6_BALPH|nr:hypothetical protein E2I00_008576 [Balaenoptera physalus]